MTTTSNYPYIYTYINFMPESIGNKDYVGKDGVIDLEKAKPYFKSVIDENDWELKRAVDAVCLAFEAPIKQPDIVDSQSNWLSYIQKIVRATKAFLDTEHASIRFPETIAVQCDGFPKIMVGADKLAMTCVDARTSLTGIEKTVNVQKLRIVSPDKVKSGVLSLFSVKRLYNLTSAAPVKPLPWMQIVNNHLDSPDRDMMECQEELIQAGLKDLTRK